MNLLAALIDDAGLFPPESLPMGPALARHAADERTESPGRFMLTHRFLCPASRLGELRQAPELERWSAGDGRPDGPDGREVPAGRLRLGLILDTGFDGLPAVLAAVADERRVALEVVEVPVPAVQAVGPALDALTPVEAAAYLEGPRHPGWLKTIAAGYPADSGGPLRGAKIRCGGSRADLFPSSDELAAFMCACFEHGLPFKASAGLHGAVRHRDERTGFVHHGFLNLLLAALVAAMGATAGDVAKVLDVTDGPALAAEARAVSGRSLSAARLLFRSYGSCSTREPQEEAAALGLLAEPEP